MARPGRCLYRNPLTRVYYARWHKPDGRRVMLSLATTDEATAMLRYPCVREHGMSWPGIVWGPDAKPNPPSPNLPAAPAEKPLSAYYPKDVSTAASTVAKSVGDILRQRGDVPEPTIALVERLLSEPNATPAGAYDQWDSIEKFWTTTLPNAYRDRDDARRRARAWLTFLEARGVRSWGAITEELVGQYRTWRATHRLGTRDAKAPMIGREILYLSRAFGFARDQRLMSGNPISHWHHERSTPHTTSSSYLSRDELRAVLVDRELDPTCRDIIAVLFMAVKRRSEILRLRIEDISFAEHWASYVEGKNAAQAAANSDSVVKAFHLTTPLEVVLRRAIGTRTSGLVWDGISDPDTVTKAFAAAARRAAPTKTVTLRNLRQTATAVMEAAGVNEADQDYALSHFQVRRVLAHYQDRSREVVARRLSALTKPGIEAASATIADLL